MDVLVQLAQNCWMLSRFHVIFFYFHLYTRHDTLSEKQYLNTVILLFCFSFNCKKEKPTVKTLRTRVFCSNNTILLALYRFRVFILAQKSLQNVNCYHILSIVIVSTKQSKSQEINNLMKWMIVINFISKFFILARATLIISIALIDFDIVLLSDEISKWKCQKRFGFTFQKCFSKQNECKALNITIITLIQINQFDCPVNVKMKRHLKVKSKWVNLMICIMSWWLFACVRTHFAYICINDRLLKDSKFPAKTCLWVKIAASNWSYSVAWAGLCVKKDFGPATTHQIHITNWITI